MSGMEWNKVFAALLVAGIIASFSGFLAKEMIHPHELHEDAVHVEGADGAAGGGPKKAEVPEPILALIEHADVVKGEKISKACAACHSFDKGGPDGTGPNMWNVVGRAKGSKAGFSYSDAMASAGGSWDYQSLNHFLWKPKKYVAGTKMNFIGLKKPEDRADLIAWLRTKADSPKALPDQAAIDAEIQAFLPEGGAVEEAAGHAADVIEDVAQDAAETAAEMAEDVIDAVDSHAATDAVH